MLRDGYDMAWHGMACHGMMTTTRHDFDIAVLTDDGRNFGRSSRSSIKQYNAERMI